MRCCMTATVAPSVTVAETVGLLWMSLALQDREGN